HDLEYCEKQPECAYNSVWRGADRWLNCYFGSITLKDLFALGAQHPAVRAALEGAEGCDPSSAPGDLGFFGNCKQG
ncbi:MAG: hypothetical protein LBB46_04590, partial [Coriobacteriaceae bacterium]|nr:hypothetical protein [Coriobacteriaceae bacterium]